MDSNVNAADFAGEADMSEVQSSRGLLTRTGRPVDEQQFLCFRFMLCACRPELGARDKEEGGGVSARASPASLLLHFAVGNRPSN